MKANVSIERGKGVLGKRKKKKKGNMVECE
jgi:hypothetical protein